MTNLIEKIKEVLRVNREKAQHYFIDSGYVAIGRNYAKNCERARILNCRDSLVDMREFNHAHTLLLGVIGGMLEVNSGKRVPIENEVVSRRFVLTAAFIQGISLCEQSILQGQYLQAGNLLRQENEILGLLAEVKNGKRQDGMVVNAKNFPWKGHKHYGELSALAHLSDHKILDSLVGYRTAWGDFASTVPQYQKENAGRLYGFHVSMVLGLVQELQDLYSEIYDYKPDSRENNVIDVASSILVQCKIFNPPMNSH